MGLFSKRQKAARIHSLEDLKPMIASGKPVLIDFMQVNCGPCQVIDGIVNELAEEYGETAHVVKVDVMKVPGGGPGVQSAVHTDLHAHRQDAGEDLEDGSQTRRNRNKTGRAHPTQMAHHGPRSQGSIAEGARVKRRNTG